MQPALPTIRRYPGPDVDLRSPSDVPSIGHCNSITHARNHPPTQTHPHTDILYCADEGLVAH